jgi:hypothetical protein
MRHAAHEVFDHPGRAADPALDLIYELLAIAPAPRPASRRVSPFRDCTGIQHRGACQARHLQRWDSPQREGR